MKLRQLHQSYSRRLWYPKISPVYSRWRGAIRSESTPSSKRSAACAPGISALQTEPVFAVNDVDTGRDDDSGADHHVAAGHVAKDNIAEDATEQNRRIFEWRDG